MFQVKGPKIQFIKDNVFFWQIENPAATFDDLKAEIEKNKQQFEADKFSN
jgi:hypothetical protein